MTKGVTSASILELGRWKLESLSGGMGLFNTGLEAFKMVDEIMAIVSEKVVPRVVMGDFNENRKELPPLREHQKGMGSACGETRKLR